MRLKADTLSAMGAASTQNNLHFDIGHATDAGQIRAQNEDSFCAIQLSTPGRTTQHRPLLLAVADGMGGEAAGEVASSIAIHQLVEQTRRLFSQRNSPSGPWLKQVVSELNSSVTGEARKRGNAMGTTLVASVIWEGVAHLANVGDSRIYRYRTLTGKLDRVVKDHSLVQMLVDQGVIADTDRYDHPRRHLVTRSLGDEQTGMTDDNPSILLQPGDWLLLCSDGLWEMVRDDAIRTVLSEATRAQTACNALLTMANANGGEDNITAVILRVH
jgi:PPM family protein phosphatase